jgi:hypothetical protein
MKWLIKMGLIITMVLSVPNAHGWEISWKDCSQEVDSEFLETLEIPKGYEVDGCKQVADKAILVHFSNGKTAVYAVSNGRYLTSIASTYRGIPTFSSDPEPGFRRDAGVMYDAMTLAGNFLVIWTNHSGHADELTDEELAVADALASDLLSYPQKDTVDYWAQLGMLATAGNRYLHGVENLAGFVPDTGLFRFYENYLLSDQGTQARSADKPSDSDKLGVIQTMIRIIEKHLERGGVAYDISNGAFNELQRLTPDLLESLIQKGAIEKPL